MGSGGCLGFRKYNASSVVNVFNPVTFPISLSWPVQKDREKQDTRGSNPMALSYGL